MSLAGPSGRGLELAPPPVGGLLGAPLELPRPLSGRGGGFPAASRCHWRRVGKPRSSALPVAAVPGPLRGPGIRGALLGSSPAGVTVSPGLLLRLRPLADRGVWSRHSGRLVGFAGLGVRWVVRPRAGRPACASALRGPGGPRVLPLAVAGLRLRGCRLSVRSCLEVDAVAPVGPLPAVVPPCPLCAGLVVRVAVRRRSGRCAGFWLHGSRGRLAGCALGRVCPRCLGARLRLSALRTLDASSTGMARDSRFKIRTLVDT